MTTKTYHVSLIAEILACVEVDSNCPEDAIYMIARDAVSLFLPSHGDVSVVEIENIRLDDIVEITQETNDAR